MRGWLIILFFLSFAATAQETTEVDRQKEVLHVDHHREIGINFNDSMLFEGLHSPTLFLRYHRKFETPGNNNGYAYRLGLNYRKRSFVRRIDSNDSGSESFLLIEPGFEMQTHRRYRVFYFGTDLHFSQTIFKADESDANMLFVRDERLLTQRYGVRPFLGYKLYLVSTLSIGIEFGYDYLKERVKYDKTQSFIGTLNEEIHTDETSDEVGLKLSNIFLSFHF